MQKLKPKILRKEIPTKQEVENIKRNPIYLVLDRVLDTYNIGSLFRLADAIAAEKVYLCGEMEYPPSSRIHKAAVGTESWVPWEKVENASDLVTKLKKEGVQIIAIEQDKESTDYQQLTANNLRFPITLVCGHETDGVSNEVIEKADIIVELPMYGINTSFNVWGATAVVAYKVLESLKKKEII